MPKSPLPAFCRLLAAWLGLFTVVLAPAQERPAGRPAGKSDRKTEVRATEVLFIGNSYTHVNDLPACLVALGASETPRRAITTRMLAPGGCTLQRHWEAAGDDAPRTVLGSSSPAFVVLQEQSRMPLDDPTRMLEYAAKFCTLADERQSKAVFFMTWARLAEPETQNRITAAYAKAAADGNALLAPVGRAWQLLRKEHPELQLHTEDGSHPSPSGTYVAACVLHGTLFGSDVRKFPDRLTRKGPDGKELVLVDLPKAMGKRLRAAAATTAAAKTVR